VLLMCHPHGVPYMQLTCHIIPLNDTI